MPESKSGLHFIASYQRCPRAFLLKYVWHIVPEFKHPALLFGIAIHEALAAWAQAGCSLQAALLKLIEILDSEESLYKDKTVFESDCIRGEIGRAHV